MYKIQASYLFPIHQAPIPNGIVVVNENGFILEIATEGTYNHDITHYEGIICPGFVNAHCHLELSHLKGVLPEKTGLIDFLLPIARIRENYDEQTIMEAIKKGEEEMYNNGIVAVGDICNETKTIPQKLHSRLKYHNFIEIFGLQPERSTAAMAQGKLAYQAFTQQLPQHSTSLSPHAPYTASTNLLREIDTFNQQNASHPILSIHNQESRAENELFLYGTGDFARLYKQYPQLPALNTFFTPPKCHSLPYIIEALSKNGKVLLVHNTYSERTDIQFAHQRKRQQNVYWCLCPNANLYIENRLPNVRLLLEEAAQIVIGTDSLTSNWQLCILSELKILQKFTPDIALTDLLTWATLNGARFFGWEKQLGSLEVGKQPGINLIQNIDLNNFKLTEKSFITKLI